MFLNFMKSKIHKATVTEADLNYIGSITIDESLMEAANIYEGEKVQVVNNNNGERLETYVIKGKKDSGIICLNGAAARKVQVGDEIIVIAYCLITKEEIQTHQPNIIFVNKNNEMIDLVHKEENPYKG